MKRLRKLACFSLVALALGLASASPANAQYRVGGGLSFSGYSIKSYPMTSWKINPDAQWLFDPDWAVGLSAAFGLENDTFEKYSIVSLAPYVRYKVFEVMDFDLWAEGALGVDFRKYSNFGDRSRRFFASAYPVLTYKLFDRWYLESRLGVGFTASTEKIKYSAEGFTTAARSVGIMATAEFTSIGVKYEF